WPPALPNSWGQPVSDQSEWGRLGTQCQPGRQWLISCKHGRLSALCGWRPLFGAPVGYQYPDGRPPGGVWVFGAYAGPDCCAGQHPRGPGGANLVRDWGGCTDCGGHAPSPEWPDSDRERGLGG